jgi:hypothetical protein
MSKRHPEDDIQRAVVDHLTARPMPKLFAFHCPNGGWRSRTEAAILKGLGVVAGVPDLMLIRKGAVFGLELKAPNGWLSPAQIATQEAMRAAGVTVAVATGLDAALAQLESWGLLRGNAVLRSGGAR